MKTKLENKKILISLILVIILSGCNSVLDQAPDGKIQLEDVFKDHFKTGAYLNTCYRKVPRTGLHYWYTTRGPVVISDEAWDNDDVEYPQGIAGKMYNGEARASGYPMTELIGFTGEGDGKYYERYFEGIRDCAIFIANIEKAKVKTEETRNRWKAEAHVLRAYYYSELLRWYGTGLPIIRDPYIDIVNGDYSKVVKPTYKEVVDFVIEDLDMAMATEELPWRIVSDAEAGRVTKALASAIRSRMTLYAASPLYCDGENYWEEAYQANKKAFKDLEDHGYELYRTLNYPGTYQNDEDQPGNEAHLPNKYAALLNEYFTTNPQYSSNPIDKETIFFHWYSQDISFYLEGIGAQGNYKCGSVPTQEMVDAYETKDGVSILDLKTPYLDEKHLTPNYNNKNSLYDLENPYANRDPRFYASVYYNGSKRTVKWASSETPECKDNWNMSPNGNGPVYRTRIISTWVGEPLTGIHTTSRTRTRTGYYLRKFLSPHSGDGFDTKEPKPKLFRLGEVILNLAEAAAETSRLEEAINLLNQIRSRSGMPELKAESMSKEEVIMRVRHERRIEMAFEGHRYFDVRRWQEPSGSLESTDKWLTAMEIIRHEKSDGSFSHYSYKRRPIRMQERACYDNKYLKAPIPQSEANKLYSHTGEIWQNPGW